MHMWREGWMDKWVDEWTMDNRWMDGHTDGWVDGQMDEWEGQTSRWTNEEKNGRLGVWRTVKTSQPPGPQQAHRCVLDQRSCLSRVKGRGPGVSVHGGRSLCEGRKAVRSQKPWCLLSAPICLILDTAASSGNPATSLTAPLLCERLTCLRSSTWSLSVKRR